jgi:hypothetical protein
MLSFKRDLAEQVVAGTKTVTRRLVNDNPRSPWYEGKCGKNVGQDYAVCPGRGETQIGRVVIVSTRRERLGELDDDEARREGFPDAAAFREGFEAINGTYDPDALVWRVEMRPA